MIKDSGNRTEFDSGAVRDIQEGKGRFDLVPLGILAELMAVEDEVYGSVLNSIYSFMRGNDVFYLYEAFEVSAKALFGDIYTAAIEVSIQFEEGAKKYGDNNWQKGIPVRCYISSAIRHLMKHLRGDIDEPHDRAFLWNLMCLIWTVENIESKVEVL